MKVDANSRLLGILKFIDEEIGRPNKDEDRIRWLQSHVGTTAHAEFEEAFNILTDSQYQRFVEGDWDQREKMLKIMPLNVRVAVRIIRGARIKGLEII
jgi:hypothetical protein